MPSLPRCPFPGCPIRYHAGPDRECADHQNEAHRAAAELGIDFTWMTQPAPGDGDGAIAQGALDGWKQDLHGLRSDQAAR